MFTTDNSDYSQSGCDAINAIAAEMALSEGIDLDDEQRGQWVYEQAQKHFDGVGHDARRYCEVA